VDAPSFTVRSPTEIVATAPESATSNQGVRVQVTANGERSSASCRFLEILQLGCDDAFFYASTTPFAAAGKNRTFPMPLSDGVSGFVRLGSWSVHGQLKYSHGDFPQAVLGGARLSVKDVTIRLRVRGGASVEGDIPLPVGGLPDVASLVLHIGLSLNGTATIDDRIAGESFTFDAGWVNGRPRFHPGGNCTRACLGDPRLTGDVSGALIVGPWLRIGFDHLNVAAGPAAGIAFDATGLQDTCAGVQGAIDGSLPPFFRVAKAYDLFGLTNVRGTFADCPLSHTRI
jgi:hypothetical protein